jgi:two-component system OmpR family sensor kinase
VSGGVAGDVPGTRTRLSRVPLRITLVALLVVLVALALVATGAGATAMLRGYLVAQQDDDLRASLREAVRDPDVVTACLSQQELRLPNATYLACLSPTGELTVLAGPSGRDGEPPDLAEMSEDASDPDGGHDGHGYYGPGNRPTTMKSADGRTSWRVVTGDLPGGNTLVLGTDLGRDQAAIGQLVALQVVVGLIVLVVLGVAGYLLVRNSLRPLTEVERTARAIAAGDLSQRVPEGDDRTEVGRLSTALNGMLSRIEHAFRAQQASEAQARGSEDRMRRFVADASHELRTPLTSIRGFAELYRQGAVRTEDDVRRLMGRIETEGARMGMLVEDLLLLARLDQQRPLTIGPVDLAAIAGDAVHDARAVQPARPISLHLDETLADVPVVQGDEARLRQVVGNLVTNALTHTPPDTRVTVSVEAAADDPDVLVLRVADEGPGMDADDAERAFERFYRVDTSRTREAGGTGLGLAIVASLVAAHGGSVVLDTAPGRGADVAVRLPRRGPAPTPPDGGGGGPA